MTIVYEFRKEYFGHVVALSCRVSASVYFFDVLVRVKLSGKLERPFRAS